MLLLLLLLQQQWPEVVARTSTLWLACKFHCGAALRVRVRVCDRRATHDDDDDDEADHAAVAVAVAFAANEQLSRKRTNPKLLARANIGPKVRLVCVQ